MKLSSPLILANMVGACVFLVLGIMYLMLAHSHKSPWNMEAAKFFAMLFGSLSIATSIALSK